jgi:hypothetical protein
MSDVELTAAATTLPVANLVERCHEPKPPNGL